MKRFRSAVSPLRLLAGATLLVLAATDAGAARPLHLDNLNRCLAGTIIDYTRNHGRDRRIWAPSVCQRRDLYVYLPPGFDPAAQYPLVLWLHGLAMDEDDILKTAIVDIDRAIRCGRLPPHIIAIPDGTLEGDREVTATHTGFINSRLGHFEDYLHVDVWNFLCAHYPIRPERQAHVIAGASLGGAAAYVHAIKHRDRYGAVVAVAPPLNNRWLDCHGRYFGNFNPCCWGWRQEIRCPYEPVGRFGLVIIPIKKLVHPLFGRGDQAIPRMSQVNPIEMLDAYDVRPGELEMFVAYGGKDEFNIDAQIESFLYRAGQKGLEVAVRYDPQGTHSIETARSFLPAMIQWLAPRLAPYSPVPPAPAPAGAPGS